MRADEDPFVLLITDRLEARRALIRGIETVMRCRCRTVGSAEMERRPHLVVIDVEAAGVASAMAGACAAGGNPVPSLILRRGALPSQPALSPSGSLPANASHETILCRIFEMIEAAARAAAMPEQRLRARSEAGTGIVVELFDSAALGAGLQPADADRGTDIVLEAVSEAGIGDWLAEVWRHDTGVYQHTLSVAGYAAAFGTRIGLRRTDHHRLAKAALLHDIGKARIPADILNKPARLSPEELRLMRRHPGIGADLLVEQGGFEPAVIDVVRHHHEKLDGTGYPDALRAEAIPDLVRIVSICDVFSALTEKRLYREPIDTADALKSMARMRGHLDTALLRAFEPVVAPRDKVTA